MKQHLIAYTVRENKGKSFWTRIGVAFPTENGGGFSLYLEAVPASVDGQYKIIVVPPREEERDVGDAAE